MSIVFKLEIESIVGLDNVDGLVVRRVSQDQLLKEEEGSLVRYTLTHLHIAHPRVGRVVLLAVVALHVRDYELHLESLL